MSNPIIVLVLLLSIQQEVALEMSMNNQFVYKKDLSVYCQRRVVSSVFLGTNAVDTNSRILHFSRLEHPYSCILSVRAEFGNDIILVLQMVPPEEIIQACRINEEQFLVYEMDESYSGYWGVFSQNLFKEDPSKKENFYTRQTTQPTTTHSTHSAIDDYEETNTTTDSHPVKLLDNEEPNDNDFIVAEVPLVNVSVHSVPGEDGLIDLNVFDIDKKFDFFYDVMPRSDEQYHTNVFPLVEVSVQQEDSRRDGEQIDNRYEMNVDLEGFTPDSRLIFPNLGQSKYSGKPFTKYKWNENRFIKSKKHKHLFTATDNSNIKKQHFTEHWLPHSFHTSNTLVNLFTKPHLLTKFPQTTNPYILGENDPNIHSDPIIHSTESTTESDILLEDIIKSNNKSLESETLEENKKSDDKMTALRRISDIRHKFNAYEFTIRNPLDLMSKKLSTITKDQLQRSGYSSNTLNFIHEESRRLTDVQTESLDGAPYDILSTDDITTTDNENTVNQNVILDITSYKATESGFNDIKSFTGVLRDRTEERSTTLKQSKGVDDSTENVNSISVSMVDHKSWENIVQAAPVMADFLNYSIYVVNNTSVDEVSYKANVTEVTKPMRIRKKRYIQAIPIENARPILGTERTDTTTVKYEVHTSDSQELAQLVELQDDETRSIIAVNSMQHYMGSVLFNLCDYGNSNLRHVFVVNSSRLIIALKNFTIEYLSVVLTTASTLHSPAEQCSPTTLECQVSGTRVCVDTVSACDGIPNCGAPDIYDEDRLMCGKASGLKHNVSLAACSLLGVLLTVLYVVHYWTRRCVPHVSRAFFVFNNGTDNALNLNTVMRSPTNVNYDSKTLCLSNLSEDEMCAYILEKREKRIISRLTQLFGNLFLRRNASKKVIEPKQVESKDIFSYAQSEIRKMIGAVDKSMQTGDSLEMSYQQNIRNESNRKFNYQLEESASLQVVTEYLQFGNDIENTYIPENVSDLNIIKFVRESRSVLTELRFDSGFDLETVTTAGRQQHWDEKELRNTMFEVLPDTVLPSTPSAASQMTVEVDVHSQQVPQSSRGVRKHLRFDREATEIDEFTNVETRRNVCGLDSDLEIIEEDDQPNNTGRDFLRFWGSAKGKKSKKNAH